MSNEIRTTEELVESAAKGDDQARLALLERYRAYLKHMVAGRLDRRTRPRFDASDIVQETLSKAARHLDDYLKCPPLPFVSWLRGLAAEEIRDAHQQHLFAQRRAVTREIRSSHYTDASALNLSMVLVAQDTSPSNRVVNQERIDRVIAVLKTLEPWDREVLELRYLEGLTIAQVSEVLNLSEGTVAVRQFRALRRLKQRLEMELLQ